MLTVEVCTPLTLAFFAAGSSAPSALSRALRRVGALALFIPTGCNGERVMTIDIAPPRRKQRMCTRVRSTASGLIFNLARLVAFPLPWLTAFLFTEIGGYQPTVLILTLLYAVAIIMLSLLPETKGKLLPT